MTCEHHENIKEGQKRIWAVMFFLAMLCIGAVGFLYSSQSRAGDKAEISNAAMVDRIHAVDRKLEGLAVTQKLILREIQKGNDND